MQNELTFHIPLVRDAVELLKELPDESVQLVMNPPYNIDIEEWDNYENYLEWARFGYMRFIEF